MGNTQPTQANSERLMNTNHVSLVISPDYDSDHTEEWKGYEHSSIFPAVYSRYRVPVDEDECERQVQSLTDLITAVNDQYQDVRNQAYEVGLSPSADRPTKDRLKSIKSARTRYEAVRRAYSHWLCVKRGVPTNVSLDKGTQYSLHTKIEILAAGLKEITTLYLDDLSGLDGERGLAERLESLKSRLETVFGAT